MTSICSKEQCTGCHACAAACPHQAIRMQPDALGFLYPVIDERLCTKCGACSQSCPALHVPQLQIPKRCYAAVLPDREDLLRSPSGGAATAFARMVIAQGGVVYGACGEDIFHVRHIRIDRPEEVERIRGSKYVQSDVEGIYPSVQRDLQKGLKVLFTGTPCQVGGLKGYLQREYNNLLTVDLVCHGVPSQQMLNENISSFTREKDGRKIKVEFRRKTAAGRSFDHYAGSRIEYGWYLTDPPRYIERRKYEESYIFAFIQGLSQRESCYHCPYATVRRVSDITVSDFWGLGPDVPFQRGDGVSCCLLHTTKGALFFEQAKESLQVVERDVREAIWGNRNLRRPTIPHPARAKFSALYPKVGFKRAVNRCLYRLRLKLAWQRMVRNLKNRLRL